TKKVKMHITLNEKGEIRVFNTFKGLNPSDKNEEGKRMPGDWVEYQIASALNQISQKGYCDPIRVSQWRKSLGFGVKIGDHMQDMKKETYLGHSKGLQFFHQEEGYFEFFIPHGSTKPNLDVVFEEKREGEKGEDDDYFIQLEEHERRNSYFRAYGWDWETSADDF